MSVMKSGEGVPSLNTKGGLLATVKDEEFTPSKNTWDTLPLSLPLESYALRPEVALIIAAHCFSGLQFTSLYVHLSAALHTLPSQSECPAGFPDLST